MCGSMYVILRVFILYFWFTSSAADRDCGGVFEENEFIIESPNYLNILVKNTNCEFIFRGEDCPTTFVLNFLEFNIEDTHNCSASGLIIEDRETLCGEQSSSKKYHSQNGFLKVMFHSNNFQKNLKFKIFVKKSSCHFKFLNRPVKRSILDNFCKSYEIPSPHDSSTDQKLSSAYYHNPLHLSLINQKNVNERFCCADKYSEKNFIITSPNFQVKNNPANCVFHIYRANENICRLRLNFVFFWNGFQSDFQCQNGYLEIDGRSICGCRVGLKLTSAFDVTYGSGPKVIRYISNGQPSTAFRGFVIEIIQDECPHKYNKEYGFAQHRYRRWAHYHNNIKPNWIDHYSFNNGGSIPKHLYSGQSAIYLNRTNTDEDSTYIDISHFNPFSENGNDFKCKMWGIVQWAALTKKALWNKMPKCTNAINRKCFEIGTIQGCLKSPGYPFYYPNNLNQCYRFVKLPGYCSLKLIMLDFMLQDSYQCSKDFLLLANTNKFCGSRLYNTYSHLTFSNGKFEDMLFVTDNMFSCRGFKVWFEQVPCEYPIKTTTLPITSTTPITTTRATTTATTPSTTTRRTTPTTTSTTRRTTTKTTTTTTTRTTTSITTPTTTMTTTTPTTTTEIIIPTTTPAPQFCSKEYGEESFVIEHYGFENNICSFTIFKYHPDVCLLNLQFIIFDLPCADEYLLINGTRYCGRINSTVINFNTQNIRIIYYRKATYTPLNLRIQIVAKQEINCFPDPEASPENIEQEEKQYETEIVENKINEYAVVIKNLNQKMCGLIIQVHNGTADVPTDMCSMLKNVEDRIDCILLADRSIYSPYVNGKIELVVASMEVYNNMKLKEVRCGDEDISKTKPVI